MTTYDGGRTTDNATDDILQTIPQVWHNSPIVHLNKLLLHIVIKVCPNGGITYSNGEIIVNDNLNKANLLQTFENVLLQYSTEFLDIAHIYCSPWVYVIKDCSNGGTTYIIGKIIAKDNFNIANLMQTFENLLLQNCSTEFLDISNK